MATLRETRDQTIYVHITPQELRAIADAIEQKPGTALSEAFLIMDKKDDRSTVGIRFIGI